MTRGAWYHRSDGIPADQPCGLRVQVPSRLGPEVPEDGSERASGAAVQGDLRGDRRAPRVRHRGARSHAGPRPRVRLGTAPLESRRAGERTQGGLGPTPARGVPRFARGDVGRTTLERWVLRPRHWRCGDIGCHPAVYPVPASA